MENVVACTLIENTNVTASEKFSFLNFLKCWSNWTEPTIYGNLHIHIHLFLSCISDILTIKGYNLIDRNILIWEENVFYDTRFNVFWLYTFCPQN